MNINRSNTAYGIAVVSMLITINIFIAVPNIWSQEERTDSVNFEIVDNTNWYDLTAKFYDTFDEADAVGEALTSYLKITDHNSQYDYKITTYNITEDSWYRHDTGLSKIFVPEITKTYIVTITDKPLLFGFLCLDSLVIGLVITSIILQRNKTERIVEAKERGKK